MRVAPAKNPSHDLGQAVEAWTEASGVGSGRLLRSVTRHGHVGDKLSVRALNILVRRAAERAGLESEGYMAEVRLASP